MTEKKLTPVTFTRDQLSENAFDFYTKCKTLYFIDDNGVYYSGAHQDGSLATRRGTIEDVNAYLEHFTNTEEVVTGNGQSFVLDYEGQGFASKQFIEHLIHKHRLSKHGSVHAEASIFSILFIEKVISYGLEHERISKDGLAYFLIDLIPELEFEEVCGYYADECLTDNGQTAKLTYWKNYDYYKEGRDE